MAERAERRPADDRVGERRGHLRSDGVDQLRADDRRVGRKARPPLRPLRRELQHVAVIGSIGGNQVRNGVAGKPFVVLAPRFANREADVAKAAAGQRRRCGATRHRRSAQPAQDLGRHPFSDRAGGGVLDGGHGHDALNAVLAVIENPICAGERHPAATH